MFSIKNRFESLTDSQALWLIYVFVSMIFVIGVSFSLGELYKYRQKVEVIQGLAKVSPVHKFVVDKYLSCRNNISDSKDECVVRVMSLSEIKGVEFQSQVSKAILDIGLVDGLNLE